MVNCSEIPEDIINAILNRVRSVEDFVRCGAVCKSWRSVTVAQKQLCHRSFNPWLLLPEKEEEKARGVCFSISSQKKFRIEFLEVEARICLGSYYGWLMTLGLELNISLLNPLSRAHISLPKVTYPHIPETIPKDVIARFAVSSTPSLSNGDLVVMIIQLRVSLLAFASPGNQNWTSIQTQGVGGGFEDVIYFNAHFYTVRKGYLYSCEINTPNPKVTQIASPPQREGPYYYCYHCFLVEMSGHLHLVVQNFERILRGKDAHYATVGFEVYRFDFHSRKWTYFSDIGDYAMFFGTNASFSISTSDYPELNANSIYFTWNYQYEGLFGRGLRDMGVHDYQNKTNKPFYSDDDLYSIFSGPLLFMPAL